MTATFLFDRMSRGGRCHESERRERGRAPACSQCVGGEGCSMWSFGGMKLCFEVQDGQSGWNEVIWGGEGQEELCGKVNQRQWSVILTTTSVVYCSEFIILSNSINKTHYLPLDTWFLHCFGETWSSDVGQKWAGDETSICMMHKLSKHCISDSVVTQ